MAIKLNVNATSKLLVIIHFYTPMVRTVGYIFWHHTNILDIVMLTMKNFLL